MRFNDSINEKNLVGHIRSSAFVIPITISSQPVTFDGAFEVRVTSWYSLAFRNVADPGVGVRAFPSIMEEMNGLFRIKGDAEQEAQ
jgi:hypothetical protein